MIVDFNFRKYGNNVGRPSYVADVSYFSTDSVDQALTRFMISNNLPTKLCTFLGRPDPLSYSDQLFEIIKEGWLTGIFNEVEIETSGQYVLQSLENFSYVSYLVNIPVSTSFAVDTSILKYFRSVRNDTLFRFVIGNSSELVIVNEIVSDVNIPRESVLVNCTGTGVIREGVHSRCLSKGYRVDFSQR